MAICNPRERASHASIRRFRVDPGLVLAALALASATSAQVIPEGPEFQVNSYTTFFQGRPAIAKDAAGNFVVAWISTGSNGTDTLDNSVQAQRYDAAGVPQGSEFQVNSYTTGFQGHPAIAMHAAGNFIVAWLSVGSAGTDSSDSSIQAQRFDAGGVPQGDQFQVNTYTTNYQSYPAVAVDAAGNFVVAWESIGSSGSDSSYESVQARRFDANGVPLGGEFQVNTYTTYLQVSPAIAVDAAGNFVVAWTSDGSNGTDTYGTSIQAQRFDSDGGPQGGEIQVNTFTTYLQWDPTVARDSAGAFIVAWSSYGSSGPDYSRSVQAQRFEASGAPHGGQFQVNAYTPGQQISPAIAVDAAGNFVVAWQSSRSGSTDSSGYSIQAQRFSASGVPRGGPFQVNSYTTSRQSYPAIAANAAGDFVVAWDSLGSSGSDVDSYSIHAQRYHAPFFADGFDSGDLSGWSEVEP